MRAVGRRVHASSAEPTLRLVRSRSTFSRDRTFGRRAGTPHPYGTAASSCVGDQSGQAAHARVAPPAGVGTGVFGRVPPLACLRPAVAPEVEGQSAQPLYITPSRFGLPWTDE